MPASLEAQRQPLTHDDLRKFCEELLSEIKIIVGNQVVAKPPTSLLRLAEVMRRTGYGRSSIYQKVASGEFPAPVDLGGGRGIAWREDEVDEWVNNRPRIIPASSSPRGARRPKPAAHNLAHDRTRGDVEAMLSP